MNLDNSDEPGGRFRLLLQRALRGDHESAWQLLDDYGTQLLHLLLVKRRERRELAGDASKLVAQIWEFLRGENSRSDSIATSTRSGLTFDEPDEAGVPADLSSADVSTVGLRSPDFPTLNASATLGVQQSAEEQVESARRRWKHLLVTPAVHSLILQKRLHGESIVEIANKLGLAEPVVKHVLQHQARQEGPMA